MLTLSVVSHQQADLVSQLLADITAHVRIPLKVVLTVNVPESAVGIPPGAPFSLEVIDNPSPKGFGTNHNAASATKIAARRWGEARPLERCAKAIVNAAAQAKTAIQIIFRG